MHKKTHRSLLEENTLQTVRAEGSPENETDGSWYKEAEHPSTWHCRFARDPQAPKKHKFASPQEAICAFGERNWAKFPWHTSNSTSEWLFKPQPSKALKVACEDFLTERSEYFKRCKIHVKRFLHQQ